MIVVVVCGCCGCGCCGDCGDCGDLWWEPLILDGLFNGSNPFPVKNTYICIR